MENYAYPHLALTFHLALFTHISNAGALRDLLVHTSTLAATPEGDTAREAVNFAFIDASMVTSRLAILTACYQACLAERDGSMRTRTVHSEVLWCMNPTSNITDALRRFGLSANTKSLLLVHISPMSQAAMAIEERMRAVVHGQLVSLDGLSNVTDWAAIRKAYKLASDQSLLEIQRSSTSDREKEDRQRKMIDETVVSLVAMKSVAA